MRDDGGGALSAITVSSRELVVRGAAGAGLGRGRAAAQLQRAGLLAHEPLCVCVERPRARISPSPPEGYTDQLALAGSPRHPIPTGFTPRRIGCATPSGYPLSV